MGIVFKDSSLGKGMALHYTPNMKQTSTKAGLNSRVLKIVNKMLPAIFNQASSETFPKFADDAVLIRHLSRANKHNKLNLD